MRELFAVIATTRGQRVAHPGDLARARGVRALEGMLLLGGSALAAVSVADRILAQRPGDSPPVSPPQSPAPPPRCETPPPTPGSGTTLPTISVQRDAPQAAPVCQGGGATSTWCGLSHSNLQKPGFSRTPASDSADIANKIPIKDFRGGMAYKL
jgi:hypothetical protein